MSLIDFDSVVPAALLADSLNYSVLTHDTVDGRSPTWQIPWTGIIRDSQPSSTPAKQTILF